MSANVDIPGMVQGFSSLDAARGWLAFASVLRIVDRSALQQCVEGGVVEAAVLCLTERCNPWTSVPKKERLAKVYCALLVLLHLASLPDGASRLTQSAARKLFRKLLSKDLHLRNRLALEALLYTVESEYARDRPSVEGPSIPTTLTHFWQEPLLEDSDTSLAVKVDLISRLALLGALREAMIRDGVLRPLLQLFLEAPTELVAGAAAALLHLLQSPAGRLALYNAGATAQLLKAILSGPDAHIGPVASVLAACLDDPVDVTQVAPLVRRAGKGKMLRQLSRLLAASHADYSDAGGHLLNIVRRDGILAEAEAACSLMLCLVPGCVPDLNPELPFLRAVDKIVKGFVGAGGLGCLVVALERPYQWQQQVAELIHFLMDEALSCGDTLRAAGAVGKLTRVLLGPGPPDPARPPAQEWAPSLHRALWHLVADYDGDMAASLPNRVSPTDHHTQLLEALPAALEEFVAAGGLRLMREPRADHAGQDSLLLMCSSLFLWERTPAAALKDGPVDFVLGLLVPVPLAAVPLNALLELEGEEGLCALATSRLVQQLCIAAEQGKEVVSSVASTAIARLKACKRASSLLAANPCGRAVLDQPQQQGHAPKPIAGDVAAGSAGSLSQMASDDLALSIAEMFKEPLQARQRRYCTTRDSCAACGKRRRDCERGKLKLCHSCLAVPYCSRECQRSDWDSHGRTCREAPKQSERMDEAHGTEPD